MRQVLCVQVEHPTCAPSTLEFEQGVVRIGRDPLADVCLPYRGISRIHAIIEFCDGDWLLEDVHSTNGTHVNGELIEVAELKAGDSISIGPCRLMLGIEYRLDKKSSRTDPGLAEEGELVAEMFDAADERTLKAWR